MLARNIARVWYKHSSIVGPQLANRIQTRGFFTEAMVGGGLGVLGTIGASTHLTACATIGAALAEKKSLDISKALNRTPEETQQKRDHATFAGGTIGGILGVLSLGFVYDAVTKRNSKENEPTR